MVNHRYLASIGVAVCALMLSSATGSALAQEWSLPRTAEGQADLNGVWDFRTITPLERPSELADQEFLTDEEAAEFEYQSGRARNADLNRERVVTDRQVVNGTTETADLSARGESRSY